MISNDHTIAWCFIASSTAMNIATAADDTHDCAQQPVSARGELSKFKWIARTKTRANWRQKVRAITGLGDPYANWNRATDAKEYCVTGPDGVTCEFIGIPCKKASK